MDRKRVTIAKVRSKLHFRMLRIIVLNKASNESNNDRLSNGGIRHCGALSQANLCQSVFQRGRRCRFFAYARGWPAFAIDSVSVYERKCLAVRGAQCHKAYRGQGQRHRSALQILKVSHTSSPLTCSHVQLDTQRSTDGRCKLVTTSASKVIAASSRRHKAEGPDSDRIKYYQIAALRSFP